MNSAWTPDGQEVRLRARAPMGTGWRQEPTVREGSNIKKAREGKLEGKWGQAGEGK